MALRESGCFNLATLPSLSYLQDFRYKEKKEHWEGTLSCKRFSLQVIQHFLQHSTVRKKKKKCSSSTASPTRKGAGKYSSTVCPEKGNGCGQHEASICHACSVASVFATLWTATPQAPLFMGFSRQGYWSGLPCCPPGDLPDPGIKPTSLRLLYCQAGSLPLVPPGKFMCAKL